eukprot:jgi/Mesvir1/19365/Mv10414-RA.1
MADLLYRNWALYSFVQFVDDQVEDWERILRHVQTIVIPEHRSIDDLEQELHGLVGIQTVITAVAERVRTELAARRGEVAEAAGAGRHEFVPTVAGAGVPRAFAGGIGDEGVAAGQLGVNDAERSITGGLQRSGRQRKPSPEDSARQESAGFQSE